MRKSENSVTRQKVGENVKTEASTTNKLTKLESEIVSTPVNLEA